jgi:hypothetical protein
MFGRDHAALGDRVRGKMAALTLAAGLILPGALVALTPSIADAQGSDPLGPTIAQVETFYAEAVANTQQTQQTLYRELFGPFGLVSGAQCLVGDALSGAPLSPCVG